MYVLYLHTVMGARRNFRRGERALKRPPSRQKRPPPPRICASAVLGASEACSHQKILVMAPPHYILDASQTVFFDSTVFIFFLKCFSV